MQTLDLLVAKLQRANYAYHNTGTPIMTDAEYDKALEQLRRLSPSHPFLAVIGAPVSKGVMLPVIMGSQDKVIAGQGSLERWTKKQTTPFVVSEKLDGLSALYVYTPQKRCLYLRGDGVKGVDVSRIIGTGAVKIPAGGLGSIMVRGELVMPSASVPAGSIGRSLINGWVHRSLDADVAVPVELAAVRFVAYQVLEPAGMSRSQQFTWLGTRGFEVPWWASLAAAAAAEKELLATFMERKAASAYPLDGLVLGTDTVPVALGGGEARNPPDSVAFKAALDDQKAETTVVSVVWTASRQGMLIPRIQIEPVEIGGATIQWLSGHNAALIAGEGIGPGARIVVRRSGDVIPALDEVLEKVDAALPPAGTWTWDGTKVHAMAGAGAGAGDADAAAAAGQAAPALLHALQTLGVEGIGPGLVAKLCEAGFDTMVKLWKGEPAALAAAIGAGRGPALMASLKARRATASMSQLLAASNRLPRGVGERKMRVLFDLNADPRAWPAAATTVPGWSADSLAELFKALPKAIMWIEGSFPGFKATPAQAQAHAQAPQQTPFTQVQQVPTPTQFVVFTGVRDKELEAELPSRGWAIQDAVSGKTSCVVVAYGGPALKSSAKTKKAAQLGVKIMTISEFAAIIRNKC